MINKMYVLRLIAVLGAGLFVFVGYQALVVFMKVPEPVTYEMNGMVGLSKFDRGLVIPEGRHMVVEGGSMAFTFEPNSGFKIATVTDNNRAVATTSLKSQSSKRLKAKYALTYTVTDVRADHIVMVSFVPINYALRDGGIYYKEHAVIGIDPGTFKVLGADFGTDRRGVFYASGDRLEEADPATFEALQGSLDEYGRDREYIFWTNRRIYGADVESFEILGGYYSKDAHSVYYEDKRIENVDVASFEVIGDSYAKDKTTG